MPPTGVRPACATHSLQARVSPVEQSIQLQTFSCQPVSRRKIMCLVTKMPAPLVKFILQVIFQIHCYS